VLTKNPRRSFSRGFLFPAYEIIDNGRQHVEDQSKNCPKEFPGKAEFLIYRPYLVYDPDSTKNGENVKYSIYHVIYFFN
jgi:hypothetical protein